jgi:hypothetical protein
MYKTVLPTLVHGRMWCSWTEINKPINLVSENNLIIVSDVIWHAEISNEVTDFVANITKAKLTVVKGKFVSLCVAGCCVEITQ